MSVSETRREAQSRALVELGRLAGVTKTIKDALDIICRRAAKVLDVERVTVWRLDDEAASIECMARFERREGGPTIGARLYRSAYPSYFDAVTKERWIAAHAARTDRRTAELADDYLIPLDIHAMLDAPVRVAGKTVGVVCNEQSREERVWTPDEQAFAASIADLVALCLETERSRAVEAAHRRTSELLEVAAEAAKLGAWSWQLEDDVIEWSPGVATIYGRSEGWAPSKLGEFLALIDERDAPGVLNTLERTIAGQLEDFHASHRVPAGEGQVRFVEAWGRVIYGRDGEPVRIAGVVSDVTDRRELETELLQAQKMEGLGRLAGGVAHDLNNLLMVMKGNVELVSPALHGHRDAAEDLQQVATAIERASDLVRQLLTFARREPISTAVCGVEALVERVEKLLVRVLGDDIQLTTDIEPELYIEVDPGRFEQVLVNLAVNARDAMPEGGKIAVEAQSAVGPNGEAEVAIVVRDEGEGLGGAAQDRAFEPFFTTKAEGRGTGLGLSICYGIVKQAGGRIGLRAAEPKGTEAWLRFPAALPEDARTDDGPRVERAAPNSPRRSAVILLVEDELAVRRLLARVLISAGYQVHDAGSPEDALSLLSTDHIEPDLILSDLVMPGMPVAEFHRQLVERAAGASVIWMSGYSEDWVEGRLGSLGAATLLPKPFDTQAMLELIDATLNG